MAELEAISINGISLDPAAPTATALGLGNDDADDTNYILVQTTGLLTKAHKEQLKEAKVEIKERVGEKTYLCRYEPKKLKPVRDLDFVKWASVYSTHFVVSPKLRTTKTGPGPGTMAVLATKPHTVDVIYHQGTKKESKALKEEIAKAAHVHASALPDVDNKIRMVIQERYLDAVARIDEVQSIVEVRGNKLMNNVARNILMGNGGVTDLNDIVIGSITFRGQNQIIAVADTGIDDTHPAFKGRIKETFALGRPGGSSSDPQGHGTHVFGSVLGNAPDKHGLQIQGVAPEAELVMQSVGDSQGALVGIPPDLNTLFLQAFKGGARVHSNSWGDTMPAQRYESSAKEIDQFVHDHPNFVICFAAGNDGTDANRDGISDLEQIGSQAAAKNCITVGASENFRPDLPLTFGAFSQFNERPFKFDPMANNLDGMAAFSSRGPTQENRVKPDVVAPGTGILSALSKDATDEETFGVSGDPKWFYDAGTSMATPLVSGCAAIVRQALQAQPPAEASESFEPSAALVKAVLINGAVELKGQYVPSEAGASPNYSSGWGRVNLTESVTTAMNSNYVEGRALDDEEFDDFDIAIKSSGSTLKVTLVWSDPPAPFLQNNLDLIVATNGETRHGNAGRNRTNNVEQVVWADLPEGAVVNVRVEVRSLTVGPQAYGLAWSVSS